MTHNHLAVVTDSRRWRDRFRRLFHVHCLAPCCDLYIGPLPDRDTADAMRRHASTRPCPHPWGDQR